MCIEKIKRDKTKLEKKIDSGLAMARNDLRFHEEQAKELKKSIAELEDMKTALSLAKSEPLIK